MLAATLQVFQPSLKVIRFVLDFSIQMLRTSGEMAEPNSVGCLTAGIIHLTIKIILPLFPVLSTNSHLGLQAGFLQECPAPLRNARASVKIQ